MEHKIFVRLADFTTISFTAVAATRQEAKFKVFNRIGKYAHISPKYVGARVCKFNHETYLAKVGA